MSDVESQRCDNCGNLLPAGIPPALCPRCALEELDDRTVAVSQPLFADITTPDLPRAFGEYELLEELGRGGMGVVYKARQKSLERIVAIKMLLFGAHSSSELVRRFRAEAVLAGGLHHPNIVSIYEVGILDGHHFIVMDYVEGMNLSEFLRTVPISIRETVLCVKQIAAAIHYAHECNVLHRDLKPSNVLLGAQGEPHITDFGLARRVDGESSITISGQVLGSPNYMPPEQASPHRGKCGRRSDVYGLGAILYHCLTGRPPFQADSIEATLRLVESADPISPRLLNPSVPVDLDTICLKCLEKDPGRRYETAQELVDELTRFLNNQPIHARPVNRVEKIARWGRRNPALALALGAAALFFLAGFMVSVWQARRANAAAEDARLNLYVADINLAHQALLQNNYASARDKLLAHLPSGGWPDLRGWEWRYLWNRCEPDFLFSFEVGSAVNAISISADGSVAAAGRQDGNVLFLDFNRQEFTTNHVAGRGDVSRQTVAFSPDGLLLATVKGETVLLTDPEQGTSLGVLSNSGNIFSLRFTPDGEHLLATSTTGLKAWEMLEGRVVAPPVDFSGDCQRMDISADRQWLAISTEDTLLAWNLSTGKLALSEKLGERQVPTLALSSGGFLATCDRNGIIRVWFLPEVEGRGSTVPRAQWSSGSQSPSFNSAFSPDGLLLAVAGSDQIIRVYATSNWQEHATLRGHQSEVWALAFTPDSDRLISGGKDGTIKVWDPQPRKFSGVLAGACLPLGFARDNRFLGALNAQKMPHVWDTVLRRIHHDLVFPEHLQPTFVQFTPDGRQIVFGVADRRLFIRDLDGESEPRELVLNQTDLTSARPWHCSSDSQWVAVETRRNSEGRFRVETQIIDLRTRQTVATVDDFTRPRFSTDRRYLGGTDSQRHPVIWDIQRRRAQRLPGAPTNVRYVDFSNNGKMVAVVSKDIITLWDLSTMQTTILKGHLANIGDIIFSRDDRTLFSASTDRSVKLWNVATGQNLLTIQDGEDKWEMALSYDDTLLAVGGLADFQHYPVKLWHAPSLREIDSALQLPRR